MKGKEEHRGTGDQGNTSWRKILKVGNEPDVIGKASQRGGAS